MIKLFPLFLFSLFFLFSCESDFPQKVKTYSTLNENPPLLIGHRGSPGFGGENTLAGFERAVKKLGADGIELDLLLTKDKKLVVGHDYELTRLIGFVQLDSLFPEKPPFPKAPQWYVTDFDLAELQQLKVSHPAGELHRPFDFAYQHLPITYHMPSYEEVLDAFVEWMKENPRLILYTEIKIEREYVSDGDLEIIADELVSALKKRNLHTASENMWLQSFDHDMMDVLAKKEELKALKKTQLEEWNADELDKYSTEEAFRAYLQTNIRDRGLQIFHSWKLPMRALREKYGLDFVQIAHEMGIPVHIYTFRDPRFFTDYAKYPEYGLTGFRSAKEELTYFFDLGVDAIMTDYVISAKEGL